MRTRARRATAVALLIAATSCSAERYRTYNCDGAGCRCNVGYFGATAEASGGCTPCPPAATTAAEGATDRAPHTPTARCSATAVLARRRLLPGPATAPCELLPAPPCNLLPDTLWSLTLEA